MKTENRGGSVRMLGEEGETIKVSENDVTSD